MCLDTAGATCGCLVLFHSMYNAGLVLNMLNEVCFSVVVEARLLSQVQEPLLLPKKLKKVLHLYFEHKGFFVL